MKKLALLTTLILFTIGGLACQQVDNNEQANNNNEVETNDENHNNDEEKEKENQENEAEEALLSIEQLSELLLEALDDRDLETVAAHVDPDRGLLITPYIYIEDNVHVFTKKDLANLLEDDTVYTWGIYDGKGTPIELTGAEYFEEFIDMEPFFDADDILVNDPQGRGNTINNINEVYPDAVSIEYYFKGTTENAGIDWQSVHFVFESIDEKLYLIAIVGDEWTV